MNMKKYLLIILLFLTGCADGEEKKFLLEYNPNMQISRIAYFERGHQVDYEYTFYESGYLKEFNLFTAKGVSSIRTEFWSDGRLKQQAIFQKEKPVEILNGFAENEKDFEEPIVLLPPLNENIFEALKKSNSSVEIKTKLPRRNGTEGQHMLAFKNEADHEYQIGWDLKWYGSDQLCEISFKSKEGKTGYFYSFYPNGNLLCYRVYGKDSKMLVHTEFCLDGKIHSQQLYHETCTKDIAGGWSDQIKGYEEDTEISFEDFDKIKCAHPFSLIAFPR